MNGILHHTQVDISYCWHLLNEYTILEVAQIYSVLRKAGKIENKKIRRKVEKVLRSLHSVQKTIVDGRAYFSLLPNIRPEGLYKEQIQCFWVLLDYLSEVDYHYALGTFFRISMQISDTDFNIGYVEKGAERLCMANMEAGGETQYILVVEDISQIQKIHGDRIATFATVNSQRQIEYYKQEKTL